MNRALLFLLTAFSLLAQQTVNNFTVKTNLVVAGAKPTLYVTNVAAMRDLTALSSGQLVQTAGRNTPGYGGATFLWTSGLTTTTNLGTVFDLAAGGTGRFTLAHGDPGDIRLWGAAADGATDDTIAIQSALDALDGSGGKLTFAAGTYVVDGTSLSVPSNVTLEGVGDAILKRSVTNSPIIDFSMSGQKRNVAINGLTFWSGTRNGTSTAASGIRAQLDSVSFLTVRNCVFTNGTYAIFTFAGCSNVVFANNKIFGTAGGGYTSENAVNHTITDNFMDGSRLGVGDGKNATAGLWLSDAGDGTDAGYNNLVQGNLVQNTYGEGILLRTAYSSAIGNTVTDASTGGAGGSYGIIAEGTSQESSIGMYGLGAGNFCLIADNIVRRADGGIRVSYDPANPNVVPGDVIIDNNQVTDLLAPSPKAIAAGYGYGVGTNGLRIKITNNKIVGLNTTNNTPGNADAIYLQAWDHGVVENNYLENIDGNGITLFSTAHANDLRGISVSKNTMINVTGRGVILYPIANGAVKDLAVKGNVFMWMGGTNGTGGIGCNTAYGLLDAQFVDNSFFVSPGSTVGYGISVNGTNIFAANNTGIGLTQSAIVITNGVTTWKLAANVADIGTRKSSLATTPNTSSAIGDKVGDLIWNSGVTSSGPVGWVCTTAGAPGTWFPFGFPQVDSQVRASTAGLSLDGASGSKLTQPLTGFTFGTNDFSLWVRVQIPTSATLPSSSVALIGTAPTTSAVAGTNSVALVLGSSGSVTLNKWSAAGSIQTVSSVSSLSSYYYGRVADFVLVRSSGTWTVYLDGASIMSATDYGTETVDSTVMHVGTAVGGSVSLRARILRATPFNYAMTAPMVASLSVIGLPESDQYASTSPLSATNLGFETDRASPPSSWSSSGNHTATSVSDSSVQGTNVVEVVASGAGGSSDCLTRIKPTHSLGRKYRMSFWAKSISGNTALTFAPGGGDGNAEGGFTATLTTNWQKFSGSYVSQNTGGNTRVYIAGAGTFRADAFVFEQVGALGDMDFTVGAGTTIPDRGGNGLATTAVGSTYSLPVLRTSAQIAAQLTDETGSGALVFAPAAETLTYSSTTVTVTAGKGPLQRSELTCTNSFTLTFNALAVRDGGTIVVWPAVATNCTVTLPSYAYGPSGTTLTITGGTGNTNYTELAWKNNVVDGTNRVSVNALNYYR